MLALSVTQYPAQRLLRVDFANGHACSSVLYKHISSKAHPSVRNSRRRYSAESLNAARAAFPAGDRLKTCAFGQGQQPCTCRPSGPPFKGIKFLITCCRALTCAICCCSSRSITTKHPVCTATTATTSAALPFRAALILLVATRPVSMRLRRLYRCPRCGSTHTKKPR